VALTAASTAAAMDVAVFALLSLAGVSLEVAQASSFSLAVAVAVAILWRARGTPAAANADLRIGVVVVCALLAYALRAGVLSLLALQWGWPPLVSIVPAALAGALAGGLGVAHIAFVPRAGDPATVWRAAALLGIAYLLALRLVYLGQLELIPQEAYYWNYAQHLDIGYLDHPPLTAWLIALATGLRDGEFFVRLPSLLSWCVMAAYATLYARDAAGPAVALRTALLASALPFFFLVGWLMTPDAPLAAAWAAALYYLQRALIDGRSRAWIGAGVAIGVGMLSKYSMILVPAAAFAFVLLDARSRRVLVSPWAWTGVVVALAVFAPVIVWNVQHDWASFTFQGARRLATSDRRFEFPQFLLYILIIVTPWAVAGLASSLARSRREMRAPARSATPDPARDTARRRWWFVVVFTLVPLAAFAVPSFWSATKLHWTGPIWLAGLPMIAASLAPPSAADAASGAFARVLARTWVPVLHALMVGFAFALFYYPVYGLAGLHRHHVYLQTGWRDLRAQVQGIEDEVLAETGRRPAVVGLDKHNTADEMAYYDPRGDGARDTASRHLFYDEDALMYEFWFPPQAFDGRDLILVARNRGDLEDARVAGRATRLGPVRTLEPRKHGAPAGRYYARVVYGYRVPERAAAGTGPAR
jgi:dolichol-phosphate mannosyltransferase